MNTIIEHRNEELPTIFSLLKEQYGLFAAKLMSRKAILNCNDDRNECLQQVDVKLFQLARDIKENKLSLELNYIDQYCKKTIRNTIYDYNNSQRMVQAPRKRIQQETYHCISLDGHEEICLSSSMATEYEPIVESPKEELDRVLKHLDKHVSPELYTEQLNLLKEYYLNGRSIRELSEQICKPASTVERQMKKHTEEIRDLFLYTTAHVQSALS